MAEHTRRLTVRIDEQYADAEAIDELTTGLRSELRALDADAERAGGGDAPPGTRAVELIALGTLIVTLAQSDVLAAVINAVSSWAGRNLRRTVRIELDGDVLELTGQGSAEQRRLTEEWLSRKQTAASATSSSRHALIVAGYEFADPGLRRLRAPAHDAEALSQVLRDPAIGDFQVRTLLNEPAPVINEAIEEFFADRKPDDLLLLHFSGHGVKDEEGELYFATAATKLNRLGATAISADFVNKRMNRSRSRRIVLLLDCCYAGAFGRGMVPRAGKQMDIQGHFGGRGRAVITASNASEYAFEEADLADSDPTPSVFTSALVDGLRTGEADADQDGFVGLDELYEYVYDQVRRTTPNQTPGKWTFDLQGDLQIARRSRPVTRPSALPAELQAAIDHPLAGVREGAVSELTRMLGARHGGLALAARLALESLSNDDSRVVSAKAAAALEGVAAPIPAPRAPHTEPVGAPVAPPAPKPRPEPHREPVVPVAVASPIAMTTPVLVEPVIPETLPPPEQPAPPAAKPEPAAPQPAAPKPAAHLAAPQPAAPEPGAGPLARIRWSAAGILAWTAIALLFLELVNGVLFRPLPLFSRPYMANRTPLMVLFFIELLPAALLVWRAARPGPLRRAAEGAILGLAAAVLGQIFANIFFAGNDAPSTQLVLLLLASTLAIAAALVDPVRAVRPIWLKAIAIVTVAVAGATGVGVILTSAGSGPVDPEITATVAVVLLVLGMAVAIVRWRLDRGPVLVTVLGALTTVGLIPEMFLAKASESPIYGSHVVIVLIAAAGLVAVPEHDRHRMLALRLSVLGCLLAVDQIFATIFRPDAEVGSLNVFLLVLAGLAIGTWILSGRAAGPREAV